MLTSNGLIHVLEGPLEAPPPAAQVSEVTHPPSPNHPPDGPTWRKSRKPRSCSLLRLVQQMHVAHRTGLGLGVVLLLVLLGGAIYVGYHFHSRNAKPFHFHYFKVTRTRFITSWTHRGPR